MLENGMLVNSNKYDIQLREPKMVKCTYCGERTPEYDCQEFGEDWVCGDCLHDYCENQYEDLGEDYISENERLYLEKRVKKESSDFWLNYIMQNLERDDRIAFMKAGFAAINADGEYSGWVKDFCTESRDWEDFVKSKLC